jgi:hypothetical protein
LWRIFYRDNFLGRPQNQLRLRVDYYVIFYQKGENMENYQHYVSGFFERHDDAVNTVTQLVVRGIPRARVYIFDKDSQPAEHTAENSSDNVLKDIVVDGAIGTVVGTGVGALLTVAAIGANVSLFVASPLIAPLVMLGWGAGMGGMVGASIGAAENVKPLSTLVHDAITHGGSVVVVKTLSTDETEICRSIFKDAVGDYTEGKSDINV